MYLDQKKLLMTNYQKLAVIVNVIIARYSIMYLQWLAKLLDVVVVIRHVRAIVISFNALKLAFSTNNLPYNAQDYVPK